jgi:hypothetical protein
MIKKISSEKGASSIMVVLLLVVLLVFGVAALTTALSSARLGQKVTDWNTKYYAAESTANERFAMIDKAVSEAFKAGGDMESSLKSGLLALGFDVSVEDEGGSLNISYEAASGDIGVNVVLSLDPGDPGSLKAVQWKEKQ